MPAIPVVAKTYESVSKMRTVNPSYSFGSTLAITKSPSLSVRAGRSCHRTTEKPTERLTQFDFDILDRGVVVEHLALHVAGSGAGSLCNALQYGSCTRICGLRLRSILLRATRHNQRHCETDPRQPTVSGPYTGSPFLFSKMCETNHDNQINITQRSDKSVIFHGLYGRSP